MAYGKPVWGIDVGQSALKAFRMRWGASGPEVLDVEVIKHPKILSQPDADEDQLIREALAKFAGRHDTRGERVVIGVPGQAAFARFIRLPPVERRKIPEIVRYEARQQIPFAIEDVLWDYQPMSTEGAGLETEIGLFAMKKDMINDFVSNFVMANIEVEVVQIAPLALYNFLVVDEQIGEGATVLLDIGAENTNLLITDGRRIWLRNIPLGGNNFTRAISKARKLTFANAEAEKLTMRQRKEAREIFAAIQPVFAELLAEVQRSMGYFTSLYRDVRIERILGMGNAFRTPGLRRYLAQNLQYRVDELRGFNKLGGSSLLERKEVREHFLALPTAYGLALQGLEVAPIHTNLLPPEIRRARIIARKKPVAAVAVGVLGLAVGLSAIDASLRRVHSINRPLEEKAKPVLQEARRYQKQYDPVIREAERRRDAAKPLTAIAEGRGLHLVMINEFFKILEEVNADARARTGRRDAGIRFWALKRLAVSTPEEYLKSLLKGEGEGGAQGGAAPSIRLEDPSIRGQRCWVYQFIGYTRAGPERVPEVIKRFIDRLKQSELFAEVRLPEQVRPLRRRIPVLANPNKPRTSKITYKTVNEWRVNVTFLCVEKRLRERVTELREQAREGGVRTAARPSTP